MRDQIIHSKEQGACAPLGHKVFSVTENLPDHLRINPPSMQWFFFLKKCIEMQLVYNVVFISAVQKSNIAIQSFHTPFHNGLSQDIEYSYLCSTIVPCLSILYICQSQTPNPSLPYPLFPLATMNLFSTSVRVFLFHRYDHLCHVLDSIYT